MLYIRYAYIFQSPDFFCTGIFELWFMVCKVGASVVSTDQVNQ